MAISSSRVVEHPVCRPAVTRSGATPDSGRDRFARPKCARSRAHSRCGSFAPSEIRRSREKQNWAIGAPPTLRSFANGPSAESAIRRKAPPSVRHRLQSALPAARRALSDRDGWMLAVAGELPGAGWLIYERIFAQCADRCQLDLVVFPASVPGGAVPGVVVLYDPGAVLVTADGQSPVTPGLLREWA